VSESTNKSVGDRRAVAHSRGLWSNITSAEHGEGVEASVRRADHHDVLKKIEALRQNVLHWLEPLLIHGAGI